VIVNIGSINSYIGANDLMAYSASKGGLLTLSRNLASSLGRWRIRVHVFNVGWVRTEGEELIQRAEGAPEDWAEQAGATRPWGRLMVADDIAAAVAFYASDDAKVFSGGAVALEQHPF
jgi:NAD(P)-dependent dehydrogenase (short-subunit alcohol dehydrogenase family)